MTHTVLIVDDNRYIRRGLCELFQQEEDFDVCGAAENGREAVDKAQGLHPDLILMDLSMPVMNGLDATRLVGCRNVRADGGWWILLRQGFLVARWRGRGSGGACDGRLRRSDGLRRGSSAPDAKRENDGRERQGRLLVRRRK